MYDHADQIRQQERTAQMLYDELLSARRMSDAQFAPSYDVLIRKASNLVRYFHALANVIEDIGDEAVRTSLEISRMLSDAQFDPNAVIREI